jgi:hypothetical protein
MPAILVPVIPERGGTHGPKTCVHISGRACPRPGPSLVLAYVGSDDHTSFSDSSDPRNFGSSAPKGAIAGLHIELYCQIRVATTRLLF